MPQQAANLDPCPEERFAAIDLGSNNCRLLVVKKVGQELEVIEVFSRIVRLGEGLTKTGRLSDASMERAIEALSQCARKIRHHAPQKVRAIATEACRRARNGSRFLHQISAATGLELEIVSHHEEAMLALRGCVDLLNPSYPYAIVFDIGGGSTEALWVRLNGNQSPEIVDCISLAFGVVTLAEDYNTESAKTFNMIREQTREQLERFSESHHILSHIEQNQVQILGTSGTATTAVAFHKGLRRYDRTKIDGETISYDDIYKTIKILQMMGPEERSMHQCLGTERGDLVLGGMAVLNGICDTWPLKYMRVADRGVREGIVASLAFGDQILQPSDSLTSAA